MRPDWKAIEADFLKTGMSYKELHTNLPAAAKALHIALLLHGWLCGGV